jgi:hypothetical protein
LHTTSFPKQLKTILRLFCDKQQPTAINYGDCFKLAIFYRGFAINSSRCAPTTSAIYRFCSAISAVCDEIKTLFNAVIQKSFRN